MHMALVCRISSLRWTFMTLLLLFDHAQASQPASANRTGTPPFGNYSSLCALSEPGSLVEAIQRYRVNTTDLVEVCPHICPGIFGTGNPVGRTSI